MGIVARYATTSGRLPRESNAQDDRPAQARRGFVEVPEMKIVLATAGLHTIEHYVQVRRARIMRWVEDRPILKLCREVERRRGTTSRLYWWEQPMDLDEASVGAPVDATTEGERGDRGRSP